MFKDGYILRSQYMYSLLCFFISYPDEFMLVSDMHRIFTRQITGLYQPTSRSSISQRVIINMGNKVYNVLPPFLKKASDISRTFKALLKKFLHSNSFYTLDECFIYSST